jgi:hypothetical protein
VTADTLVPAATHELGPITPSAASPRRATWIVVAQRYAALALIAVVLGAVHLRRRPATVCLLRALTGIPCPFCGGTTAAVDLGHTDVSAALRASPLATGLLTLGPALGAVKPPTWWSVRRYRWLIIGAILVVSEGWQLVRFGIIAW